MLVVLLISNVAVISVSYPLAHRTHQNTAGDRHIRSLPTSSPTHSLTPSPRSPKPPTAGANTATRANTVKKSRCSPAFKHPHRRGRNNQNNQTRCFSISLPDHCKLMYAFDLCCLFFFLFLLAYMAMVECCVMSECRSLESVHAAQNQDTLQHATSITYHRK